jgi:hypothetical protein
MSPEDQVEYQKQAGKLEPNTFKARYLAAGKTYKFEIEPIDFAQNRGPRTAISVEVPAVSEDARLALVNARIDQIIARATADKDKAVRPACVSAVQELLTNHRIEKEKALEIRKRLEPLMEGGGGTKR